MENNNKTNNYAIIGFVLSFFVAIAGLIVSIIGLKKSKELNSGKGLSIAGIIISIINILFSIFVIFIVFLIISYNKKVIDTVQNIPPLEYNYEYN